MNLAIDAWAQPAGGRLRERMPEVARLFEKSGSAHLLDVRLGPEETIALMDEASDVIPAAMLDAGLSETKYWLDSGSVKRK